MGEPTVAIRDVTLRDGLQLTGGRLSTDRKVQVVRELVRVGVEEIEIGSLARADLVPSLADSLELAGRLTPAELERCWMWVATEGHVRRALDAGVTGLQFCLSASEAHNRANLARSVDTSLDSLAAGIELASAAGARVQLCIATAFTCPFTGDVAADTVLRIVTDPRGRGAVDVVVADTMGQAVPQQVAALVSAVRAEIPDHMRVAFHGHDTWGLGVANALAAVASGSTLLDAALGGLGGCPFAPGAAGNTSTEDLAFALRPAWLTPDSFGDLVRLGEGILSDLGDPPRSRAASAARATTGPFSWGLGGIAR